MQIPVCIVRCDKGQQQCLAMSPKCTKVIDFACCIYVYMYASNCAMLNNTDCILLHEYINPIN